MNDNIIGKPVGRLQIGDYIVRLLFCPDGVMRMIIPADAKTDGSIIWSPARNDGVTLYGFGATPEEARQLSGGSNP